MSTTTLLQLVQQSTAEMGLAVPTVVVGSTSQDTIQQLGLINAVGYEIVRQYPWQALNVSYVFPTLSTTLVGDTVLGSQVIQNIPNTGTVNSDYMVSGTGVNQGVFVLSSTATTLVMSQAATATATGTTFTCGKVKYAIPPALDRPINRTHWDKSRHWEMLGPETPQQWEQLLSGYIATGPRIRFRMLGDKFQIWPQVTTGDVLGFDYVSKAWAASTGGTAQNSFLADTDTCIFPDRLMVLGLKKKYFEVKGFDTSDFGRDFDMELEISKANDGGAPTLSMAPTVSSVLINWTNIPDGNFGP